MRLMPFRRNGGSGTARRIGTTEARGQIVVWTDADMTYPNERIPEFVRYLDDNPDVDQVVGARTTEEGTHKWARVPAKWVIRKIASSLAATQIPDLNSGLRAFRRDVSLPYLRLLPPGFSCVTTITMAFLSNQHAVDYLPIDYAKRAGVSKFHPFRDAYRYILQVLRMVMYFNPLKVLMPFALWIMGIGVVKLDRRPDPLRPARHHQHAAAALRRFPDRGARLDRRPCRAVARQLSEPGSTSSGPPTRTRAALPSTPRSWRTGWRAPAMPSNWCPGPSSTRSASTRGSSGSLTRAAPRFRSSTTPATRFPGGVPIPGCAPAGGCAPAADWVVLVLVTPVQIPAYLVLLRALGHAVPVVVLCHNVLPHEARSVDKPLVRTVLRRADGVLVHTASEQERAREVLDRPLEPVAVAPMAPFFQGTPEARLAEAAEEVRHRLLFFGLVRHYKGLDVLIDALVKGPPDVHLTVAGEFWTPVEEFQARVDAHGLHDRVEIRPGYVAADEVSALVLQRRCSGAALPQRHCVPARRAGLRSRGAGGGHPSGLARRRHPP